MGAAWREEVTVRRQNSWVEGGALAGLLIGVSGAVLAAWQSPIARHGGASVLLVGGMALTVIMGMVLGGVTSAVRDLPSVRSSAPDAEHINRIG